MATQVTGRIVGAEAAARSLLLGEEAEDFQWLVDYECSVASSTSASSYQRQAWVAEQRRKLDMWKFSELDTRHVTIAPPCSTACTIAAVRALGRDGSPSPQVVGGCEDVLVFNGPAAPNTLSSSVAPLLERHLEVHAVLAAALLQQRREWLEATHGPCFHHV